MKFRNQLPARTFLVLLLLPSLSNGFSSNRRASRALPLKALTQSSRFVRPLAMSSEVREDERENDDAGSAQSSLSLSNYSRREDSTKDRKKVDGSSPSAFSSSDSMLEAVRERFGEYRKKLPPIEVEDSALLFYDVFLLINLVLSISFWAVHRLDFNYIGVAFSEGCLLSVLWILSGMYNGAFLNSAVDGHYGSADERGGPRAAARLGFHTFLSTVNLRLVVALGAAVYQHRPVGFLGGELLLPAEIGFGLILMTCWRAVHSMAVPRM